MEKLWIKVIRWLIKIYLPGMHLSKNPVRKPANVVSEGPNSFEATAGKDIDQHKEESHGGIGIIR